MDLGAALARRGRHPGAPRGGGWPAALHARPRANLPAERQFVYLADAAAAQSSVRYLKAQGAAAVKVWLIGGQGAQRHAELEGVVQAAAEETRRGRPVA